jgi:hypothetical protein
MRTCPPLEEQRQAWGSGSEKTSRLVLTLYDPLALLSEHPVDPVNPVYSFSVVSVALASFGERA